jgi:lipoprotein-releasing system ATP-binding protein
MSELVASADERLVASADDKLVASGVEKRFETGHGELSILRGVDLVVGPSESIAILGVSGSGKSTLLHILGGLEQPTAGEVRFGGRDVYSMPSDELARFRNEKLGFVFQFHHLLPEFDAEENVMMPCLLAGWSRRRSRARAREMLQAVGLIERSSHRPGKLSGGERQRVAIARALVRSPRLLLADEPTGNLDPRTAESVEELLLEQSRAQGTALVLVTHNEKLAGRLAQKAYLVEGRLES